jgi:esterase/lipase superfamily enzyme
MPTVTVYFATNRKPLPDATGKIIGFGEDPGPIDGYAVRFGYAAVAVDLATKTNDLVAGSLSVADEVLTPASGTPIFGSRTIFDELRRSMKEDSKPTVAFIHGFSNSFQDSIERAGWISAFYEDGGFAANIFAFSWPATGGSVFGEPLPYVDYEHDRGTAASAGPALARTIRILHEFVDSLSPSQRCNQEIHLLCHSMGNYVLRNGLQSWLNLPTLPTSAPIPPQRLAAMGPPGSVPMDVRRTFEQIILAAADEDDDAFDDVAKLALLPRLGNAVTVYHNREDWILNTLSSKTKFNGPRLGTNGPDNMAMISDKVTAVEVTEVVDFDGDVEGHQYYRKFPRVRDDIVAVLLGKRPTEFPAKQRRPLTPGRWLLK